MPTPNLEPHEFSKLFPPISVEDFDRLVADIKANGLHQRIVRYQGKILDGNNRYRACSLAGIEPTFADFTGIDADAQRYVISANIHRRHLSPDQRREIIAKLLQADPNKSDRTIAATVKVDNKTVAAVRGRMEATEEIPQLDKTTGADGKTRKRKAGKPKSGVKSEKEKITYQKVVNAKTAQQPWHDPFEERCSRTSAVVNSWLGRSDATRRSWWRKGARGIAADVAFALGVRSPLEDVASAVDTSVRSRRSCAMDCMVMGLVASAIAKSVRYALLWCCASVVSGVVLLVRCHA